MSMSWGNRAIKIYSSSQKCKREFWELKVVSWLKNQESELVIWMLPDSFITLGQDPVSSGTL